MSFAVSRIITPTLAIERADHVINFLSSFDKHAILSIKCGRAILVIFTTLVYAAKAFEENKTGFEHIKYLTTLPYKTRLHATTSASMLREES